MLGQGWVQKGEWAAHITPRVATALTAAGTTTTDALPLPAAVNMIGTAAASTGVNLPAITGPNDMIYVYNGGANTIKVYSTATINLIAGATGVSITAAKGVLFISATGSAWVSVGL